MLTYQVGSRKKDVPKMGTLDSKKLKLYKQLGLEVTKIHRILEFQQFPWLKSYINFNTDKRKAATSDIEKDFFKLMSNSVYGKSMESIRKRVNVELVNNQKRIKNSLAKPTVKNFTYVNDNLVYTLGQARLQRLVDGVVVHRERLLDDMKHFVRKRFNL